MKAAEESDVGRCPLITKRTNNQQRPTNTNAAEPDCAEPQCFAENHRVLAGKMWSSWLSLAGMSIEQAGNDAMV